MPNPIFDFLEVVAEELSAEESRVITRDDLVARDEESPLLEELKRETRAGNAENAIQLAVEELKRHFKAKGAKLPFDYDPTTGRFTATDRDFLAFVKDMSSIRSIGTRSRDFECGVAKQLCRRATGSVHRVGHPRDKKKKKAQFNRYLRKLGFDQPVSLGKEKDGGFDILWMLPVGTIPHRPIVSVQCKNGEFNMAEADKSVAAGKRSFGQNHRLQPSVHVPCVLFNDYLHPQRITQKAVEFIPLGLTDLASLDRLVTLEFI